MKRPGDPEPVPGGSQRGRRLSMIQEMQSQLPRLSLFEIHVNNSNKHPALKPVSMNVSRDCVIVK